MEKKCENCIWYEQCKEEVEATAPACEDYFESDEDEMATRMEYYTECIIENYEDYSALVEEQNN